MANRTTDALVIEIIEVDSGALLTPFITAANQLVTNCCTNLEADYTDAELIIIETWLAAHFYTVREGRAIQEKAGPVSERKQSKVDLFLSTSHYGQMAMTLDYQGGLARLNKDMAEGRSNIVGFTWMGTEKS